MRELSPLQEERLKYQPKLPKVLQNGVNFVSLTKGEATESVANKEEVKALYSIIYKILLNVEKEDIC